MEALSELSVASNICPKPSKPLILFLCVLLMDVSEPAGLIEDVDGVANEVVYLMTFSEGLGTILGTVTWELKSKHKVTD